MKPHFEVTIERYEELAAMPSSWTPGGYRALLEKLEFDGVGGLAEDELSAYATMALQDLEPEEAAQVVLARALDGKLTPGQIRNLSEEMKHERQWEEHADMSCHEPIFNAQVLLHEAFPESYPAPDVARLTLRIVAVSAPGEALLGEEISEPLLVRMLADGMPETAILQRLFSEAIAKGPFPEATQIVWQYTVETRSPPGGKGDVRVTLYSPASWVGPLANVETFASAAFPDTP